jgi:hypothetical protein
MNQVSVGLQPLVSNINLPTVIKTAILPGDITESLFIATQTGEIYYIRDGVLETFLNVSDRVIRLGASGGSYDERGLLGLAFHPDFTFNGLFYLHYSVAGSQGPGIRAVPPNPCIPNTLNQEWTDRERAYDHIDTVEEWGITEDGQLSRRRILLNLRRPFFNHNGVNSLIFSPETGRLVLTTGDGGMGYDPFNLAQDIMEAAGKIIEIDVSVDTSVDSSPVITRFNELPEQIQGTLFVMAKGVRNITGISYQRIQNNFIKYVGNVGQDLTESIYSFLSYIPIPVSEITRSAAMNTVPNQVGLINFGWRGWEGILPTPIIRNCSGQSGRKEQIIAYYEEAVQLSTFRLPPLVSYFHNDPRSDKFTGTALTGVQAYLGAAIPTLTGSVVFTDFARSDEPSGTPTRGVLAYSWIRLDCKLCDFHRIEIDYDFGAEAAFFTSLGANMDQTRLFLGVYASRNVTDPGKGTVYEIIL